MSEIRDHWEDEELGPLAIEEEPGEWWAVVNARGAEVYDELSHDALCRRLASLAKEREGKVLVGLEAVLAEFLPWAAETFPRSTASSCAKHLLKEVGELLQEPGDSKEWADCLFLVIDGARRAGVDIVSAARDKLELMIRTREWQEPDEDGVVEHVREAD